MQVQQRSPRSIEHRIHAPLVNMGPIRLRQPLPAASLEQISPFILLHHFDFQMEAGHNNFDVPPHPHRGFMPITFVYEGAVEHNDSLGNIQVISGDEVQWISAGRGIIHAEKAGRDFIAEGGRFRGVQLWINLPKAQKMSPPSYQPLTRDALVLIEKEGAQLRLVSGTYEGQKGPGRSDVFTGMMRMKAGSTFSFDFPAAENSIVYVLEGDLDINRGNEAKQHDLVHFRREEGSIDLEAVTDAVLLVLSGEPIDEPLVTHGPFVMNNQTEILEAMRDYQDGKMGYLY